MKRRSDESLRDKTCDHEAAKVAPKPHVRYLGFESIQDGRRLTFRVRPIEDHPRDVMVDIRHAAFVGTRIGIQDAALIGYEKLMDLLSTEHTLASTIFCLTDEDIARYISRHIDTHKRADSTTEQSLPSDRAA